MRRGPVPIRMGGVARLPFKKAFVPRHPFDLVLVEKFFPRVTPVDPDADLRAALLKRNGDLTPTAAEQSAISNLVPKVESCLDTLILAPGDFTICQLDQVRQVGSHKKGTMLAGLNIAEIVVILKTLPTKEACEALGQKVEKDLAAAMEAAGKTDPITMTVTNRGFDISSGSATVSVYIATTPANIRKISPGTHLSVTSVQEHLAMIQHVRWFEENATHSSIKVLIRLLKDIVARFDGFQGITPWMLDLLAHLVIMKNQSRQALPINAAFRRVFQLLSAGLFLPGSAGISDPWEQNHVRVHTALTLEQQDRICMTAQTLLRVLSHGGWNQILGLEGDASVAKEMTVWDGVVCSPLSEVYERPREEPEPEKMEEENGEQGEKETAA